MFYTSTRNSKVKVSGAEAIISGISTDGGLYVPSSFPTLTLDDISNLCSKTYPERAASILSMYLDDYSYEELLDYATKAYARFDSSDPCPIVNIDDGIYVMELFHGPTLAFKDMALTLLPYLMTAARKKTNQDGKTMILVATSGDTGKAALEGFKDVDGTSIMVFYPSHGVSDMQKLQMSTQEGSNVYVAAIDGNFDDAQTAVKTIFGDKDIANKLAKDKICLSSANSINWGRLVPQIVYYVSAYCDLVDSGEIKLGDKINFTVPTGNFGNILAGYYAMRMGLPINKLICASNENNILTDFFTTGEYDTEREFHKTISPSMDILVSSNLERLLYEISDRNDAFVSDLMMKLKKNNSYKVDTNLLLKKAGMFEVGFANEEDTESTIGNFFEMYDYLLDPHTGVAMCVYNMYNAEMSDNTPTVIVSTASPYKFPTDVYESIMNTKIDDAFKAARKLYSVSAMEIPQAIQSLKEKEVRFTDVYDKTKLADVVLSKAREL